MTYKNLGEFPIYKKALDLCQVSRALASYVSYNKDVFSLYKSNRHRDHIADAIITDAFLIPQKIAQAACTDSSNEERSNLSMIKIMCRNLLSYCNGLEKDGVTEKEYLNLLRSEIKILRRMLKGWKS